MSNPYLTHDVNTIIDAYTTPGKGTDIAEGAASAITGGALDSTMAAGKHAYAIAEEKLQNYIDTGTAAVEEFFNYGTNAQGEPEQLLGVDFKNTALTVAQAGSTWEAGATMLADCIPCKDRILALMSLNPLADFQDALDVMYELQFTFLLDLWDFLLGDKSIRVFADLCSLIQFLNFMCLPDIVSMILVLSRLVAKYTVDLAAVKITMQDLLGTMFGSTLAPLLGMFDRYIQLIVAPVECVINELDNTLQKLDVLEAWQIINDDTGSQEGWFERWDGKETSASVATAMGLTTIRKRLKEGVDVVDGIFEKLNKDIRDFLGGEEGANKAIFDVSANIEQVGNLVGFLQAVILAVKNGGFSCNPASGQEELENFINNYIAPGTDVDIEARDGIIKVAPSVPIELDGMKELLDIVGTYEKQPEAPNVIQTTTGPGDVLPELHIPVSNCLYTIRDKEIDKVKDYLSTFE